jgi:hypothetical protein
MALLDENPREEASGGARAVAALGGVLVTGALVLLVLSLGSWAFVHREGTLHVGRLERLVEKHPRGEDVRAGLEAEGSSLLGQADGATGLRALVRRVTPANEAAVVGRGAHAEHSRAFRSGPYVYWLFFDAEDRLTGFLVVPPRE